MSLEYPSLAPAIAVANGAEAIDFYKKAFGAKERYRLVDRESGKIGHAELTINGALLMVSDEYPQFNKTPQTLGGVSAKFLLMCDDVDAAFARSVEAGAEVVVPLTRHSTATATGACVILSATSGSCRNWSRKSVPRKCNAAGTRW